MKQSEIRQKFKDVFNTPDGKIVLAEIMQECSFGESLTALDQKAQNDKVAKYEVAVWINEMLKEDG